MSGDQVGPEFWRWSYEALYSFAFDAIWHRTDQDADAG